MEFCWLATIVLILSILGILFDISIFGFSAVYFLVNTMFTVLVIFITNWSCYSKKYGYIAWGMVVIHIILILLSIVIASTDFGKDIIDAEKQNRIDSLI
jgi:hypothetical protein